MRTHIVCLAILLGAGAASAQEIILEGHGPGIGVEENLGGLSGATFVYDAGRFRVDILLGLEHVSQPGPAS